MMLMVAVCAVLTPIFALAQIDSTSSPQTTTNATTTFDTSVATTTATTTEMTAPEVHSNEGLEAKVRAYFSDVPIMADIARCESKFRQFDSDGIPLDGGAGSMIGIFQINAPVHAHYAKSLGMDIYSVDGNLAYARRLFSKEGTTPWISSFSCWNAAAAADTGASLGSGLVSTLQLGSENPEVLLLQKLLNAAGFSVAAVGPGSPGHETTKFGSLTRVAVRKFQCARAITCSGDEYTTGYGLVGSKTRAALIASANPSLTGGQVSIEQGSVAGESTGPVPSDRKSVV